MYGVSYWILFIHIRGKQSKHMHVVSFWQLFEHAGVRHIELLYPLPCWYLFNGIVRRTKYNGEEVAVKSLINTEHDMVNIDTAKNELQALAAFNFMHIVQLKGYAYDITHKQLHIVMEYCNKGTLFNFIYNNQLKHFEQLIDIAIQIADGMHFLHTRKPQVMHRDLKPSNVLLHEQRKGVLVAKIADFGTIASGKQTQFAGTSVYVAPEVMKDDGHSEYDKSCDVYSFAMVLYEMFTETIPFSNMGVHFDKSDWFDELQLLLVNESRPVFPKNCTIPEVLKKLIRQCWAQDASKRPSFDKIKFELEQIKEHYQQQHKPNVHPHSTQVDELQTMLLPLDNK